MANIDPQLLNRLLAENPLLAAQLLSNGASKLFASPDMGVPQPNAGSSPHGLGPAPYVPIIRQLSLGEAPPAAMTAPPAMRAPAAIGDPALASPKGLDELLAGPMPERFASLGPDLSGALPGFFPEERPPNGFRGEEQRFPGRINSGDEGIETRTPWLPEMPDLTRRAQEVAGIDPDVASPNPLPQIALGRPAKADDAFRRDGGVNDPLVASKQRTADASAIAEPFALAPQDGGLSAYGADPVGTGAADLGTDAANAAAVIAQLQKNDPTRGGNVVGQGTKPDIPVVTETETGPTLAPPQIANAAQSAGATDGRVVPSAVEEDPQNYSFTIPGRIGQGQNWLRDKLGLGDQGSFKVGTGLMNAGAALMQDSNGFFDGLGGAVQAGMKGYFGADAVIKGDEDRALERAETQKRIEIAEQTLGLAYDKFEHDKAQAALDRLDPLKALREKKERLSLESDVASLEGGGTVYDRLAQNMTPSQQGKLWTMLNSDMTVVDPATGLLTPEAARIIYGGTDSSLGLPGVE